MTDEELVAYLSRRQFAPLRAALTEVDDTIAALEDPPIDVVRLREALVGFLTVHRPPGVDWRGIPKPRRSV